MSREITIDFNEKREQPIADKPTPKRYSSTTLSQKDKNVNLPKYAIAYGKMGLKVFPLLPNSKAPATKNGFKDATTDLDQIARWWTKNPNYNIGIATGDGLLVLDLDVNESKGYDGNNSLKAWEEINGTLPITWKSHTGSGGTHIFYHVDKVLKNTVKKLLDGIDTRCDGGYIVAPPSVHPNGDLYKWVKSPKKYELADADQLVYKLLEGEEKKAPTKNKTTISVKKAKTKKIEDGSRNDTLFRLACSLHEKGLDDNSIMVALLAENQAKCIPPLDDSEVRIIVDSATKRYEKGDINTWIKSDDKGKRKIDIPLFTEYMATTVPIINIYDTLKVYSNGYYKNANLREMCYNLMPMELRSNRIAQEVEFNLVLDNRLKRTEKDLMSERYINFRNGIYDIENRVLLPHSEDKLFLTQIPHDYDENAKRCKVTESFLENLTGGDKELRSLLLQIIGVAISDIRNFKAWFYFYGARDTGKSTFLRVIKNLLTDVEGTAYYSAVPLKSLQDENHFELYKMLEVKANICTETNPEPIRNDTILKALTGGGGETICCQRKFKESIQGTPKVMLLFAGNGEPPSTWTSNSDKAAFLSRLFPIQFTYQVPKKKQIQELENKINYSYLINLAIEELHHFIDSNYNFITPDTVLEKRAELESESDSVATFVNEKIEKVEGYKTPVRGMYEVFCQWCVDEGLFHEGSKVAITPIAFGKRFKELTGVEKTSPTTPTCGGAQCKCWQGAKIKL